MALIFQKVTGWKINGYRLNGNLNLIQAVTSFLFNDTKVKIQGQPFIIKGAFFLNSPAHFHINASTKNIGYNAAMAILKPTTSEKIKKINLTEPLDVTYCSTVSLAYKTIPLVKVNFSTKENNINTPV